MQSKLGEVTVLNQALAFSGNEGRVWTFCLYILAADKAKENLTSSTYTELRSVWLQCKIGVKLARLCVFLCITISEIPL